MRPVRGRGRHPADWNRPPGNVPTGNNRPPWKQPYLLCAGGRGEAKTRRGLVHGDCGSRLAVSVSSRVAFLASSPPSIALPEISIAVRRAVGRHRRGPLSTGPRACQTIAECLLLLHSPGISLPASSHQRFRSFPAPRCLLLLDHRGQAVTGPVSTAPPPPL